MSKYSISIIIPIYNVEPYVEKCIKSVISQTYNGTIECIMVDDCSSDNSMAIVDKVITDYDGPILFKIIHHDRNRGLSAARNSGIEVATSDYLFFLDSDDELTSDCIEKLTKPLDKKLYDLVVGNMSVIDEKGRLDRWQFKNRLTDNAILTQIDIIGNYTKYAFLQTVWNILYLTEFIRNNQLKYKEGIVHEDALWCFQVACLSNTLYEVNHTTYLYRVRRGSIMKSHCKYWGALSYCTVVVEMLKFVKEKEIAYESVHDRIQGYFQAAIRLCVWSPNVFFSIYRRMRSYFTPKVVRRANGRNIKHLIRDFHYILPDNVAPYFEYCLFFPIVISKNLTRYIRECYNR